jgi:hypothetical protein
MMRALLENMQRGGRSERAGSGVDQSVRANGWDNQSEDCDALGAPAGCLLLRERGTPQDGVRKMKVAESIDIEFLQAERLQDFFAFHRRGPVPKVMNYPATTEGALALDPQRSARPAAFASSDRRGTISGRAFQNDWEKAERGPQAVDPTREYVDGVQKREPITEGQRKAVLRLGRAERELSADGAALVHEVLIMGLSMEQVGQRPTCDPALARLFRAASR